MKRVMAWIFMMFLAVSLSSCVNSSRDAEVVPDQNEAAQAVQNAAEGLQKAVDTANVNSAAAKAAADKAAAEVAKKAEEEAAKKKAEEEAKAAEAKALAAEKKEAANRLKDFYDLKDAEGYRDKEQKDLEAAKKAGDEAIAAAKTPEEVEKALEAAKKALNDVKTDAQYTKEETAAQKKADEEAAAKKKADDDAAAAKKKADDDAAAAKKAEDDAAAAKKVEDAINGIGTVTVTSSTAIETARTAYKALTDDQKKLVPADTVAKLDKAEADLAKANEAAAAAAAATSEASKAANALALNSKLKVTQTGKKINVSWGAVEGADEYRVYVQYCGKKFASKATKTVDGNTVSVSINKLSGKALKLTKNFKIYVAAYKTINGKKTRVGKTITAHIVGRKNSKYTNAKSITIKSDTELTLTVGGSSKIKAKTNLVDKKKKQLTNAHAKQFRYKTSDKSVATVTSKGNIKAVGKGTCTIYVYSRNGLTKEVKVTVQ